MRGAESILAQKEQREHEKSTLLRELGWDQSDSSRKEFVSQMSGVDRTMSRVKAS
jgi:hypothetical protein